jgi:probable F420-dependent oxidoreductase
VRFGVALPQFGPATPEGLTRAARQAEELGFDDVWVADHVAVPEGVPYPPSFLLEALATLAFVAAVTSRVRLGTSVLVLPLRHPLLLAKQLATIERLSEGRLVLGAGAGWLEGELAAFGVPLGERGARAEETIDALRACWRSAPASFEGPTVRFRDLKVQPLPEHEIPIWYGGHGEIALRRAMAKADGWQGAFLSPAASAPMLLRLREGRPEPSFTLSMRTNVDGLHGDLDQLVRDVEAYAGAGLQHVLSSPAQRDLDSWLRSVDGLWGAFQRSGLSEA